MKYTIETLKKNFNDYQTEQLAFRNFSKCDCFPLYEATKNPTFNHKLWWGPPENQEELIEEGLKLIREHELNKSVVISACEKATGKWVGVIKFSEFLDSITMSLWLHPDYWKSRIPIRCAESAIEIVFQNTELPHIYARLTKDYPTMEKMVQLNGFTYYNETQVIHQKNYPVTSNTFILSRKQWNRKTQVEVY